MQEESTQRLSDIFEQARALPLEERSAFLDQACGRNDALRAELSSLLAHDEAATGYLSRMRQAMNFFRLGTRERGIVHDGMPAGTREHGIVHDDMPAGAVIGHYEILSKIGGGGMGVVYKARDRRLDRIVALKFLAAHRAVDEEVKMRFQLEAKAASLLEHVNICTVYDIAETEDHRTFISMAYCDGETLQKKISQGPLGTRAALDYILQIGRGLACAHEGGIVHRDIKPANILVGRNGVVKIVDFGIAKSVDLNLTRAGRVVGTTAYMSPEQARGEAVDHRTDIWSMGVVLYEMLGGEIPFKGEYVEAMMYAILYEEPTPIGALCTGIPMPLAHVVHRMLEKPLNSRYQRVEELVADLQAIHDRTSTRTLANEINERAELPFAAEVSGPVARISTSGTAKILVVDDEPEIELLIRQRFQKRIRAKEWSFLFASDGIEALEKLKLHPEINLILTDIRMPRMDGLSVLSRLGELGRPIKTLVMSAYGDMENIRMAMNRGAFDFVTKPIDFGDLETTIGRAWEELLTHQRAVEAQYQLIAMKQEMEVARRIQDAMLPPPLTKPSEVELFGFTGTALEVSGDFYDFFSVGDDRVGFLVGEVASRGVSAALVAAMSQTFLRAAAAEGRPPGECLSALNRVVLADGFPSLSVSIFLAELALNTGTIQYSNAGHLSAYVLKSSGNVSRMTEVVESPIWTERGHQYETGLAYLCHGEHVFLFTDGIPEAANRHGRLFSTERLESLLMQRHGSSAAELVRSVVREIAQFADGSTQTDDFTAVAVRYLGRPAPQA